MNYEFLILFGLFPILVSVVMILVYRPPPRWKYQYFGACFSPVIIALGVLLEAYNVVPPIAVPILAFYIEKHPPPLGSEFRR